MKSLSIFLLCTLWINLFAWGGGHEDMAKYVLKILPPEIANFWSDAQRKQIETVLTHYPDDFTKKKIPSSMLDAQDAALLDQFGITRQRLHEQWSQGISFYLLAKAFRQKDPERAALFAGVVMHTTADGAAFNHTPLTHYQVFARYAHIKNAPANLLDLSIVRRSDVARKTLENLLKAYQPECVADNCPDAVQYAMLHDLHANALVSGGEKVMARIRPEMNAPETVAAMTFMGEVGAWQVKEAANLIYTAWMLGKNDKPLEMKLSYYNRYCKARDKFYQAAKPADDAVFSDLAKLQCPAPRLGLLAECSRPMGESKLGFSSKFIVSSAGRSLQKEKFPIQIVSFDELSGLDCKTVPVLLLTVGHFSAPKSLLEALRAYVAKGGRLLMIGGHRDHGLLGALSQTMSTVSDDRIPVSSQYGLRNEKIWNQMTVSFAGPLANCFSGKKLPFRANPNTPAGWHKPCSKLAIDPKKAPGKVEPLVLLWNGKETLCVGAALKENGKYRHIYLPEYVVAPFLLSADTQMPDWGQPTLDSVGAQVVRTCVKLLWENR
ncbi:MAG: hypothetical protein PHS41_12010 [Victivallaceae bacterium]|nr:hypothetical protein [Victivallaceae bacterium]